MRNILIIILIISFYNYTIAQENSAFFKKYMPIGIHLQGTQVLDGKSSINNSQVNFDIIGYKVFEFGIEANVYQYKNLNFSIGLNYKHTHDFYSFNFQKEVTGLEYDFKYKSKNRSSNNKVISLPVTAEYYYTKHGKIKPYFSFGLSANFHPKNEMVLSSFGFGDYNNPTYINIESKSVEGGFYGSSQLGIGAALVSKPFLMKMQLTYNMNFNSIISGKYFAYNYPTEPINSVGSFEQSGNYFGLGLNLYLHRNIKLSYD